MAYQSKDILLAIQSLCPTLSLMVDYVLADLGDGQGPRITMWNSTAVAQPTQAQIEAVDTDALLAAQAKVLPQDLMAQFTTDDATKIQTAIATDISKWQLWYSLLAQRDPMLVSNARFKAGWSALVTALGQERMNAIAASLGLMV